VSAGPEDERFIPERSALEAALLRELAETWDEIAHNHFKTALRRPVLALSSHERRLGEWIRAQRTIAISRRLVVSQPWGVVREVLKHEMAHQYVDEVLRIHDESAHGPAFRRVCEAHGFDASAAGTPAAGGEAAGPMAVVLRRIARLLALAESPNVHEAAAAMNEARRLMLLHNIDAGASPEAAGYGFRHVGEVKARNDIGEKVLAGILSRHFFVSVIWVPAYLPLEGRRGRVLELCGTPANLEVAGYVHGFLMARAQAGRRHPVGSRAPALHRRRDDRLRREAGRGRTAEPPNRGRDRARRSCQSATGGLPAPPLPPPHQPRRQRHRADPGLRAGARSRAEDRALSSVRHWRRDAAPAAAVALSRDRLAACYRSWEWVPTTSLWRCPSFSC
jgi:hypothetical protein